MIYICVDLCQHYHSYDSEHDITSGTASALCLPLCSYIFLFTLTLSNTDLFSIAVLLAWKCHRAMNEAIQCVNFENSLFHLAQCLGETLSSCVYQKHIPYYFWVVFHTVVVPQPMIYSLIKDPWSSSTVWLLHMKLQHISVHRFSCEHKFLFLCTNTHEWNCGSCGKCMVKLIRDHPIVFQKCCIIFYSHQQICAPTAPHLHQLWNCTLSSF